MSSEFFVAFYSTFSYAINLWHLVDSAGLIPGGMQIHALFVIVSLGKRAT